MASDDYHVCIALKRNALYFRIFLEQSKLKSMESLQSNSPSIKKNTFYNVLKTFSTIVFPLITFPYVSRVLHAENVGKINFGSSIVSYFSLLATLGINVYAIRECSKVKDDKFSLSKIASQLFSINLVTTFVSYAILIFCLVFVPSLSEYRFLIAIQSLSIVFTVLGADWINTAMEDFKFMTIRTFVFQIISLTMLFLFVRSAEHYLLYAIIGVISSSGANIVNIFYRRRYCRIRPIFRMDWKTHFPKILLLFGMLVAQIILNNLDITMLGLIKGDRDVGLYSTALKITSIITQVIASITWVVMPQLTYNYAHKNFDAINKILHSTLEFTVVLGLPCLVGLLFLAPEIIEIVGGKEYLGTVRCCRLLAINMGLCYISNIYGNIILLPSNKEKYFFIACVVASIANSISNYFIIPKFGIEGAALTTIISQIIIVIITMVAADKNFKFGKVSDMLKAPLLGVVFLVLVCYVCKLFISNYIIRFVISFSVSAFVYFFILIILKNRMVFNFINSVKDKFFKKLETGKNYGKCE